MSADKMSNKGQFMANSGSVQDEGLVRVIGTGALGLSVVNMVVGAGIFVLPGLVAAELGSAAIFAYPVYTQSQGNSRAPVPITRTSPSSCTLSETAMNHPLLLLLSADIVPLQRSTGDRAPSVFQNRPISARIDNNQAVCFIIRTALQDK